MSSPPTPQALATQPELPLDLPVPERRQAQHSRQAGHPRRRPMNEAQVLAAMREHFEQRWSHWHPARTFEVAMRDPFSARLLRMAVSPPGRARSGARERAQDGPDSDCRALS